MTVGADEVVELCLLANPKNAERQKTHEIREQSRGERDQGALGVVVAVNGLRRRHAKVQHEQRHRDRENAVAQGGKSFYGLPRDLVVRGTHHDLPKC